MASWTYVDANIGVCSFLSEKDTREVLTKELSKCNYDNNVGIFIEKIPEKSDISLTYNIIIQTKTESLTHKDFYKVVEYFETFFQKMSDYFVDSFYIENFTGKVSCPYWDDGGLMFLLFDSDILTSLDILENSKHKRKTHPLKFKEEVDFLEEGK